MYNIHVHVRTCKSPIIKNSASTWLPCGNTTHPTTEIHSQLGTPSRSLYYYHHMATNNLNGCVTIHCGEIIHNCLEYYTCNATPKNFFISSHEKPWRRSNCAYIFITVYIQVYTSRHKNTQGYSRWRTCKWT